MTTPVGGNFSADMQNAIAQQQAITAEAMKTNVEIAKSTTVKDAYGKIR